MSLPRRIICPKATNYVCVCVAKVGAFSVRETHPRLWEVDEGSAGCASVVAKVGAFSLHLYLFEAKSFRCKGMRFFVQESKYQLVFFFCETMGTCCIAGGGAMGLLRVDTLRLRKSRRGDPNT